MARADCAEISPASRGRKGRKSKKPTRRPALPATFGAHDECDCPACSSEDFDPKRLIDELLAAAGELIESEDPLDAELASAAFVSIGEPLGEAFEEAVASGSSRSSRPGSAARHSRYCW
ncbi:MAG: hypothetical protein M3332_10250 [Actinomycetota bacterium]|nr:hypothetical protein [Actinomycetota bacterium]